MKKTTAIILSVLVLCTCCITANAEQHYQGGLIWDTWETLLFHSSTRVCPRRGDLDVDGQVTVEDARLALRAVVGLEKLESYQHSAIAFNGSGSIVISKARAILRCALGLTTLDYDTCVFDKGREIAFGPFANADNGKYNWVCEVQNSELFQVEERSISDEDAEPGTPVRQYFFITGVQERGTCDITFRLQDSQGTECLAEYTLSATVGFLIGATAE